MTTCYCGNELTFHVMSAVSRNSLLLPVPGTPGPESSPQPALCLPALYLHFSPHIFQGESGTYRPSTPHFWLSQMCGEGACDVPHPWESWSRGALRTPTSLSQPGDYASRGPGAPGNELERNTETMQGVKKKKVLAHLTWRKEAWEWF